MNRGRAHSPLPPPREPKAGTERAYGRDDRPMPRGGPPPPRRRRSPSPRGRGPSPGPYKRHRREDEYYERHDRYGSPRRHRSPEYGRGGYDAPYDDFYHQPPPPPKRGDERGGGGGGPGAGEPRSFKRFLMEDVPDSVSPVEAQALYEQYLTAHFGDQLRARFEQEKTMDSVRAAFHPAAFESSLARHKEEAAAAAQVLAADIRDGRYDPARPDFNQGQLDPGAEAAEDGSAPVAPPPGPEGPVALWRPERVAADYRAAKRLAALLDHQRGLRLADNPLLPAAAGAGEGEAGEAAADGKGAAAAASGAEPDAALAAVLAEAEGEVGPPEGEEALQERLGQLDLLLTWLWRVHGLDYYGGRELLLEAEYADRAAAARTVRGPRPEEGEEQDEEEAKVDAADLAERVDSVWAARVEGPDPLLAGCQREEIEKRLEDYVESQIKMENEKKWGSTFSNKFFLEKRFVVKHIENKHGHKLDEQRDVIRDDLYWLAYEAANKAKHAAARAEAKQRESAARVGAAAGAEPDAHMAEAGGHGGDWQEGYEGEEGFPAAAAASGGRGAPGRLGPMRGRGGRMAGMGRGGRGAPAAGGMEGMAGAGGLLGGLPLIDPSMMMMGGMGGLPGPIILPGPGMGLPGMPGGMPMGPMLLDPSMMAGGELGGMPLFIPAPGGGRGMRGGMGGRGRGGMMGGRGRLGMSAPPGTKLEGPGYLKHYYDLDAPAHNRAVLDYGDL
ncbi:hypothetical protein OEZ85_010057 [Tetradesmus obliquus]|uniref:SERRATE/Ars2 C-terminal domain-containing protein n=1 Tax=Tetradesmus obliquus TaxID=3088 RepID=A0ABY8TQT2_TETOB|nr:hypothetical protein OEZ85_010057 [Tetradesmus obliquus]